MEFEEIGTVKYGNLRFVFEMTASVRDFLLENSIESQALFPQTQFFYQGVLMKLGINHEEEKTLKIIFHGIRIEGRGVCELSEEYGEKFENFPIHVDDLIYYADFVAGVKD